MINTKYTGRFSSRLNFVDDKDNYVGWDDSQSCCESHFWGVFTDAYGNNPVSNDEAELARCSFNLNVVPYMLEDDSQHVDECGGVMVFELLTDEGGILYLLVGNDHNGYYSHSYEYAINGLKGGGSL